MIQWVLRSHSTKVFGIGLSKTGTTSLFEALEILGYHINRFPSPWRPINGYDGAVDTPVAAAFEEIDRDFPGSRFVYTIREMSEWLESCAAMWARRQRFFDTVGFISSLHQKLYGTKTFDHHCFAMAYRQHDTHVRRFFQSRRDHLLVIDLTKENFPWHRLCAFLHHEVPKVSFPHSNSNQSVSSLIAYLVARLRESDTITRVTDVPMLVIDDILSRVKLTPVKCPTLTSDWETRLMLRNAITVFNGVENACKAIGITRANLAAVLEHQ